MHILIPTTRYLYADLNENGKAVHIPESSFDILQTDFDIATHFSSIKSFNFKKISGIYIRASNQTDALITAIYAYKQYAAQNELQPNEEPDDVELVLEDDDPLLNTWPDGTYQQLPVIDLFEYLRQFNPYDEPFRHRGAYIQREQLDEQFDPYWASLAAPLIIETTHLNLDQLAKALEMQDRFVILIESENSGFSSSGFGIPIHITVPDDDTLPNHLKSFLFETNIEYVQIPKAEMAYLETLLPLFATHEGYAFAKNIDKTEIVNLLKEYRQNNFQGATDLHLLIKKAIRYTDGHCIDEQAMKRFFLNQDSKLLTKPIDHSTAYKKLHNLIGLEDVKIDLIRLIERMKFAARRKKAGLPNLDHHMAAVFAGSPGTCKTTVARIFGELLLEANVLTNNIFLEISRKDLIGQYVGWTAPKVQEVFDKAKGGTIFIDEAYSLLPMNHRDAFSEEALATIIQCMENNPETLVIFAGYTQEMMYFIQNANTGLRSRLTNIIQFDDYNSDELIQIFYYNIKQGNYVIEQTNEINEILRQFITNMHKFSSTSYGNGRLMRKLLSTAIGFMATRSPNNLNLLTPEDISVSCEELIKAETFIQQTQQKQIGFSI